MMDQERLYYEIDAREGYALWAPFYDSEVNALIAAEELYSNDIVARLSFKNALDVGAGTGRYLSKLAHSNVQITAVDQAPEMLELAQQAAQKQGLSVNFCLASLDEKLPFSAQTFDMLTCALVLNHVPRLSQAIQEFARVLQNNGYMLITDLHPACFTYGWRGEFRHEGKRYLLPTMPHTREDYLQALTKSGLTILEVHDIALDEIPAGYFPQAFIQQNSEKFLILIVLAQKK
ncbi:MAG TPA: methyltransferase domain-containing protein [Ktedonobacteraceae bacterium]|nr:methyltransferase domain-containing protein [Ktedonobacteraceae bacterium]